MKPLVYFLLTPLLVYILLTFLPNTIGCMLPEYMCMSGTEKLSDVLTITAALIPAIFVAEAYRIWRKQKSAELLADHAQKIYENLKEIAKCLDKLELEIKNRPGTTTTFSQEYKDFVQLHGAVKEKLDLFKLLLDEENSTHCKKFNDFYKGYVDIGENLKKINLYRIKSESDNLYSDLEHYQKIINQVKLVNFKSNVQDGFKLLAKIILHK